MSIVEQARVREWRNAFRDWWRGFSNEDLASALRKTETRPGAPGEVVWLMPAEFKAWVAFTRRHPRSPGVSTVHPDSEGAET